MMAEGVIEIHRKRISEHRKNSGTSTEIANNINLVEKINENESERSADGENNNEERVLTKSANSKVFLTKIFPRRPLSLPVNRVSDVNHNLTNYLNDNSAQENGNNEGGREKKRKTFHQDVEEALNSLLWQPYEYQNKRTFSDSSSFSLSYTSCSSSLSSLDLEDYNNGSSAERVGNVAMDLHPGQEEMVNNLSLNRRDQSEERPRSRDRRKASRLSSGCARTTVSECCAAFESCAERACDDFGSKCDMRLEVPPSSNGQDGSGGSNCCNYQRSISAGNLSSANVVGLPPRQASMPTPPGNAIMFPNHPRNVSEPLPFRFSQPPAATAFNHQRHSSHVDSTASVPPQNLVQHMRSASVPKSMQPQKVGESNAAKMINEGLQRALNVSNVNVNFYRAVPVNVVSSVPTIQCVNSSSDAGNNVSNVHIMPLSGSSLPTHNTSNTITTVPSMSFSTTVTGTTQVSVHNTQLPSPYNVQVPTHTVQVQQSCSSTQVQPIAAPPKRPAPATTAPETRTRTFTSTEAQTDEISVCSPPTTSDNSARERRRERRRQQRRLIIDNSTNTTTAATTTSNNERLPDILNSHLPPPYSPPVPQPRFFTPPSPPGAALVQSPQLVPNIVPSAIVGNAILPYPPPVVPGQVPLVQTTAAPMPVAVTATASGFRFPFPANGFRRGRYSDDPPKGCCGLLAWKPGSLRWFIVLIALVGVCCVLVGTALGAMRPAGRDHLTVSLLMIGVGIILVTVSGVAWRLTSHDASNCRSLWGLGGSTESIDACGGTLTGNGGARRFVPRLPPSYGRPHHPYAAMMYPEFQYRPPPPSYQASMQEYRLRLLLLDRGNTPQIQAAGMGLQNAVSPPPTYRSHAGSLLRAPLSSRRDTTQSEYSCPPSYRSQTSSTRPPTLQSNAALHSREQSISLSDSNQGDSVVNVVSIFNSTEDDIALDNLTIDSLKMEPEADMNPVKMSLKGSASDLAGSKDGNLVTIVQTNDQSPVIVTVSGSSHADSRNSIQITEIPTEMEILAHL